MNNYQKWESKLKALKLSKADLKKIRSASSERHEAMIPCPWRKSVNKKCHICLAAFPRIKGDDDDDDCPCIYDNPSYIRSVMKRFLSIHEKDT